MKIIAKQNGTDSDMIELYSRDMKYLIAVCHIDNFFSEPLIHGTLNKGSELTLTLVIDEGEA